MTVQAPAAPALGAARNPLRHRSVVLSTAVAVAALSAVLSVTIPDHSFPVSAMLLGPLLAAAAARPVVVALLGAATTAAATAVAAGTGYSGGALGWRVAVVGIAAVGSVIVASLRLAREREVAAMARRVAIATTLQRGLLPSLSSSSAVVVRSVYRPGLEDLMVSGDFIDVLPYDGAGAGALAFCVGDVTGHDAVAAGVGASLRAAWRALALTGGEPHEWLATMDRLMASDELDDRLATAAVGIVDPANRRLLIATAGHPRPILLGDDAEVVEVEAGPPLGLPHDLQNGWVTDAVGLHAEFALVLYTDGLIEGRRAPGSKVRYGEESLTAWLSAALPARTIDDTQLAALVADVEAANGGALADDTTVVVLGSAQTVITLPEPRSNVTGRTLP